jgi:hypothetical protein
MCVPATERYSFEWSGAEGEGRRCYNPLAEATDEGKSSH